MTRIDPAEPLVLVFLALIACFVLYTRSRHGKAALPLPPGPKGLPLIGNAFDIPLSRQWETFQSWAQAYGTFVSAIDIFIMRIHSMSTGDVVYLSLLGQSVVVLNSVQATSDLLDRRSGIYSDRFRSTVVPL